MKNLFIVIILLSSMTSFAADVHYKIRGNEYIVTVDGLVVNGAFVPYPQDYLNVGVATVEVSTKAKEVGNCISVKRYEYLRTLIMPQWNNTITKFCSNRILTKNGKHFVNPLDFDKAEEALEGVIYGSETAGTLAEALKLSK